MAFDPIVKSIIVDGQEVSAGRICKMIKRFGSDAEEFVQFVLSKYGENSEMFLFVIQSLIYRVVSAYCVDPDTDLLMDVLCAVLEKIRNYEPAKGKLCSYIHTVVRGEITKWMNRKKGEDKLFVKDESIELYGEGLDNDIEFEEALDTVYRRVELWERVKAEVGLS